MVTLGIGDVSKKSFVVRGSRNALVTTEVTEKCFDNPAIGYSCVYLQIDQVRDTIGLNFTPKSTSCYNLGWSQSIGSHVCVLQ